MKKLLIVAALALSAVANEIQVFTSNTMHIELDSDSKSEKIFSGKSKDYFKQQNKIIEEFKKNTAKSVVQGTIAGAQYSANAMTQSVMAGGSGAGGFNAGAAGIGIAVIALAAGGRAIYDSVRSDNEYFYISRVVNSANKETVLFTTIVANNKLAEEEIEEIGFTNQKQKLKGL